jgi:hypothetical protein
MTSQDDIEPDGGHFWYAAFLDDVCRGDDGNDFDIVAASINHAIEETFQSHLGVYAGKPRSRRVNPHAYDDLYCQDRACEEILRLTSDSYTSSKERMKEKLSHTKLLDLTGKKHESSLNLFQSIATRLPQGGDIYCTPSGVRLNHILDLTDTCYQERYMLPNRADIVVAEFQYNLKRKACSPCYEEDFEYFMSGREPLGIHLHQSAQPTMPPLPQHYHSQPHHHHSTHPNIPPEEWKDEEYYEMIFSASDLEY